MSKGRMSESLESVISSSIAGLPGSDASSGSSSSSDTPTDSSTESTSDNSTAVEGTGTLDDAATPAADPAAAAAAQDKPIEPVSPPDDSLEGLEKEMAGKRDNRIPHSRVKKIAENAAKAAEARVEAKYAQFNTPEFRNERTAMNVADQDPERFLKAMAQADPRYAELLAGSRALGGGGGEVAAVPGAKPKAKPQAEIPDGDIEPDIQLSDGTLGYSAEAQQKREERLGARLRAEFEEILGERMKGLEPVEKEHRQRTLRKEAESRVEAKIEKARKWPAFEALQEDIANVISEASRRGEYLDLYDAYIQVAVPKFQKDEAAIRAQIVAEQNRDATAATRVAPGAGKAKVAAGGDDVDPVTAAIRESIAGLKR